MLGQQIVGGETRPCDAFARMVAGFEKDMVQLVRQQASHGAAVEEIAARARFGSERCGQHIRQACTIQPTERQNLTIGDRGGRQDLRLAVG